MPCGAGRVTLKAAHYVSPTGGRRTEFDALKLRRREDVMRLTRKAMSSVVPALACLTVLVSAPLARANSLDPFIDYDCGGAGCGGSTITETGTADTAFSTTGIPVHEDGAPGPGPNEGKLFTLAFDTSTKSITLTGPVTLTGTITKVDESDFSPVDVLILGVAFPSLPAAYATFFGSTAAVGLSVSVFLQSDGTVTSSDTTVTGKPASEASTISLLGLVLLGGLWVRRKQLFA